MDTEVLISEVNKRRLLWDKRSKLHHNRYMLGKAWGEIASVMDCSIKEARTKWKNLKDHFRKEFKKDQDLLGSEEADPDSGSSWSHYKSLLFLKDQFVSKKSEKFNVHPYDVKIEKAEETDQTKSDGERIETEEKEDDSFVGPPSEEKLIDTLKTTIQPLDCNDGKFRSVKLKSLMKIQNKGSSSTWGPPKKRLKAFESSNFDTQIEDLKNGGAEKKTGKGNENYHFVMTLLPHLDRLSPAKRLAVQIKIQQAVFSAIYGSNRSSSDSTTSYDSTSSF